VNHTKRLGNCLTGNGLRGGEKRRVWGPPLSEGKHHSIMEEKEEEVLTRSDLRGDGGGEKENKQQRIKQRIFQRGRGRRKEGVVRGDTAAHALRGF